MGRIAFLVVLACLLAAPAAAWAAPTTLFERGGGGVASTDPDTARTLALSIPASRDHAGALASDVLARVLDRAGRPVGPERSIGSGLIPEIAYNGGSQLGVALDTRRHRWLVAWSAHKPGMPRRPCGQLPGPPGFTDPPPTCAIRDREIVVRVLDRLGRPVGPERQVTVTGGTDTSAVVPSVAYDARNDAFLIAYAESTDNGYRGLLHARRLHPDGRPLGGQRRLALRPEAQSTNPIPRVVARPSGGFLLAFTWGDGARHLYLSRLTPGGRPTGPVRALTTPPGPGSGGIDLVAATDGSRALVMYSLARSGARSGFRALAVDPNGRPLSAAVALPYESGFGPVIAAPEARGRGWLYAFGREGQDGRNQLVVQAATPAGRPTGAQRRVSPGSEHATGAAVVPAGPGRFQVTWGVVPFLGDAETDMVTRRRAVRPPL